jgi:hypothetical protein
MQFRHPRVKATDEHGVTVLISALAGVPIEAATLSSRQSNQRPPRNPNGPPVHADGPYFCGAGVSRNINPCRF